MSYGQHNPYTQGPSAEAGGYQQQQYGGGQYEMQPYGDQPQEYSHDQSYQQPQSSTAASSSAPTLTQQDFLSRIQHVRSEIRQLTSDIERIGQLHQRALSSTDDAAATRQLDQAVAETQLRNTTIKSDIKTLERDALRTQGGGANPKRAQVNSVKNTFKDELQRYMQLESDYEGRYKEQIARQYRIVNPDATEDEVQRATEADWGDEGVFQTALKSNRTGQANSVLGNVRARHNEIQRIERNLGEVAQLFQEMAVLVEQQESTVVGAQENAQQTVDNLQKGNEQVKSAEDLARHRRKLKWWCLLISVLIVIVIALGVGLGVGLVQSRNNN